MDATAHSEAMPPSLTANLGEHVARLQFSDLPDPAVECAIAGVLDYAGVTLAGSTEPAVQSLMKVLSCPGGSSVVFGMAARASALDAALVNGTASHALDFDDVSNSMGGHPTGPVLAALFGLADEMGASGSDFLVAYVAGFEVEARLGRALGPRHATYGWHPTGTLGVFGAAAASAKLMGANACQIAMALGIAASFASGIKANFGTMTKPLHVGHCARNGLLAAKLGATGYTANEHAFEHEHGFLNAYNGGPHDNAKAVSNWGHPFDIVRPGIAMKQYPCCASIHPALDAALALVSEHAIQAADVTRVEAWIHARRLAHTNRPRPVTGLDAKFSVQYCLARAFVDGKVALAHFRDEACSDAAIAAFLPRIHAAAFDAGHKPEERPNGGEVQVTLRDGRKLAASVLRAAGRGADHPLPRESLRDKFFNCCAEAIPTGPARALHAKISNLAAIGDTREITALARP